MFPADYADAAEETFAYGKVELATDYTNLHGLLPPECADNTDKIFLSAYLAISAGEIFCLSGLSNRL